MKELKGFEVFEYGRHSYSKAPRINITKNGIMFSKACLSFLDFPENVILLINKKEKQLAIQPCEKSKNSIPFCVGGERKNQKRIVSNALKEKIQAVTGWDLSKESYRIFPAIMEGNILVFDLKKAEKYTWD